MAVTRRFPGGVGALLALALSGTACQTAPDVEPQIELLKSLRAGVRETAAAKLVIWGEAVVPRLIEESGSEYTRVRFEVARILGRIRDPRAGPALIRLLDDSSFNVAAYAAWGLGQMRVPEALPRLLRFPESPAKRFRQQVVWALGQCYDDTVHAALADSVLHVVERALHDPTAGVRVAALQSARELGYPGMVPQLLRMVQDPAAEVRHVAVQALGQAAIGDTPRPFQPLPAALRERVVEALGMALDDPYQSIRTKAVRALERMGPPPTTAAALRKLQADGTEEDRREAGRVLEALEDTARREALDPPAGMDRG